jgi:oligopeptidase B
MSRTRHSNRRSRALLTAALVALPPMVPSTIAADQPVPVAKKRPTVRELHGDKFIDDYFWLREKGDPEVTAYLEAENAYAETVMAPYKGLQDTLYKEMLGRIKETDLTVPVKDGAYFYYTRTQQGQQYTIYCRKKGSLEAPEEVYLDVNALAKGEKFMAIGALSVSDDGNLLAYTTDTTGFREYKLYVRDLRTGELLEQPAEKVTSVDWAADDKTLFYTTTDAAKRPYRLYRHRIGADGGGGVMLYEEKDERFSVGVGRSRSRAYLFLEIGSLTASEVHYLAADQPAGTWKIVAPRQDNHEYDLDHRGDQFFVRTNQGGRNFALAVAPVSDPSPARWKMIVPHRADVMLQGTLVFDGQTVLFERANGLPRFRVAKAGAEAADAWTALPFPEPAYTVSPGANPEFKTSTFRYTYQSFTTPLSVFDYDFASAQATLQKETEVLGGYDRTKYTTERVSATAPDGTKVPISLVYLKTLVKDGNNPIYLTAYGSYGFPSNVSFSSNRFSLVDRGVVYAVAHIRGGGDLGKPWHDQGRMLQKKNTFTDFIASAEYLIAQKYGAAHSLAIEGGSAGGLLMGAVANMRPDLFRAVVAQVPFVDVINTMTDTTLPLTVGEFEEWGNPAANRAEYEYIKGYDPYRNLKAQAYPAMLVKTSLNDSQVMYWEPAKYVARMRTLRTDTRPLVFKINMAAGHGGSSGRYDRLKEVAFDYSFILWQLGLDCGC